MITASLKDVFKLLCWTLPKIWKMLQIYWILNPTCSCFCRAKGNNCTSLRWLNGCLLFTTSLGETRRLQQTSLPNARVLHIFPICGRVIINPAFFGNNSLCLLSEWKITFNMNKQRKPYRIPSAINILLISYYYKVVAANVYNTCDLRRWEPSFKDELGLGKIMRIHNRPQDIYKADLLRIHGPLIGHWTNKCLLPLTLKQTGKAILWMMKKNCRIIIQDMPGRIL